jgi:hypothetical protein
VASTVPGMRNGVLFITDGLSFLSSSEGNAVSRSKAATPQLGKFAAHTGTGTFDSAQVTCISIGFLVSLAAIAAECERTRFRDTPVPKPWFPTTTRPLGA